MMTGEEYKASLFDGRATFFEGKRVDDLPAHPFLGPPVQQVADDYDWLADPGGRRRTARSSACRRTPDELRDKVDLVHHAGMMAHVTYTSIMTLATAAGRIERHGAAVRRADQRLHRRRPAARHPHHPVHHRRQGRPLPAAGASRTTPTPTSTSSTAARTASSSAAPSCTSPAPRSATT